MIDVLITIQIANNHNRNTNKSKFSFKANVEPEIFSKWQLRWLPIDDFTVYLPINGGIVYRSSLKQSY